MRRVQSEGVGRAGATPGVDESSGNPRFTRRGRGGSRLSGLVAAGGYRGPAGPPGQRGPATQVHRAGRGRPLWGFGAAAPEVRRVRGPAAPAEAPPDRRAPVLSWAHNRTCDTIPSRMTKCNRGSRSEFKKNRRRSSECFQR